MDQITAFDWQRLFIGDEPPLFLLEIVFRIAVIWPWTMVLLRWIGGRSISQLSLVEFLLVIAPGSAVGAVCRACCGQGVMVLASDMACPNCGAKDWTRPA